MLMRSVFIFLSAWLLASCATGSLSAELQAIADSVDGKVGIAVISDCGDTIRVNDDESYPLMSVFKLHQAIASCNFMEKQGISPDSMFIIPRSGLNPSTWSPMLTDFSGDSITINYRGLLRYALVFSDNNASNILFDSLVDVRSVDTFISHIIPRDSYQLRYTEAEMQEEHSRAYENCTTPSGAAILINRLYSDSTLLSTADTQFIRSCLEECATGTDRILAPLLDIEGVSAGHKTGSGYRDNGILVAHNDVAFVKLPGNRHYTLSVFVKDFNGSNEEASAIIAHISGTVYTSMSKKLCRR